MRRAVFGFALLAAVVAGCGGGTAAKEGGNITILAAASLTGTFTQLGQQFEAAHPGVHVTFSFAGSSTLAQQVLQGAPADVFASADQAVMQRVVKGGGVSSSPAVFATNSLEIAVPQGNPGHVTGLVDLAKPNVRVALCAVEVPCGTASRELFAGAGVTPHVSTYEADVKAVLTKVELGEVDAGLVYRTDVKAAGDRVVGVEVPEAASVVNSYPIAVLSGARNSATAKEFVDYVRSDAGEAVLRAAGFGAP